MSDHAEYYILKLYIAGQSAKAIAAFSNLKAICEEELKGRYEIEVIDLLENPKLAREDQIVALPTLVRKLPPPLRKVIGDLSDTERVLIGLDLLPRSNASAVKGQTCTMKDNTADNLKSDDSSRQLP